MVLVGNKRGRERVRLGGRLRDLMVVGCPRGGLAREVRGRRRLNKVRLVKSCVSVLRLR